MPGVLNGTYSWKGAIEPGTVNSEIYLSNLVKWSNDLTQWNKTNVTATANQITDDATLGLHHVALTNILPSGYISVRRTVSVRVQAGTARYITFSDRLPNTANVQWNNIFDTQTGTWARDATFHANYIEDEGGGVFRIWFEMSQNSAAYDNIYVGIANGPNLTDISYSGSGDTIFAWDAQVNVTVENGVLPVFVPTNGTPLVNARFLTYDDSLSGAARPEGTYSWKGAVESYVPIPSVDHNSEFSIDGSSINTAFGIVEVGSTIVVGQDFSVTGLDQHNSRTIIRLRNP